MLILSIGALFAALIGYYMQIAFVFFLPWILFSVLLVFVCLNYYAKRLWVSTMTEVPLQLDTVPPGFEMLGGLFTPSAVDEGDNTCEYTNANGAVIHHCKKDATRKWRICLSKGQSHDDYVFYAPNDRSPTPPVGTWLHKSDSDTTINLEPKLFESSHVSIYYHGQLIQLVIMTFSYSFSRLLYSSYIWRDYFVLFVVVLFGFLLTFLWWWYFALSTQMNFLFALSLPPHRSIKHLNDDLWAVIMHKSHHFSEVSDAMVSTEIQVESDKLGNNSAASSIQAVTISAGPLPGTFPPREDSVGKPLTPRVGAFESKRTIGVAR